MPVGVGKKILKLWRVSAEWVGRAPGGVQGQSLHTIRTLFYTGTLYLELAMLRQYTTADIWKP